MRTKVMMAVALLIGAFALGCSAKNNSSGAASNAPASNAAAIRASALQTQGAGTAAFTVTLTAKGTPLGDQSVTGSGAVDLSTKQASFNGQVLGSPVSAVVDNSTAYVQSGLLGPGWHKIDASTMKGGNVPPALNQVLTNPAQAFDLLKSVSGNVTTVGTEAINGVSTTHYRVTVDPSKVATALGATAQPPANAPQVPVDVWVDGQNLIRQLQMSYTPGPNSQQTMVSQVSLTVDVTSYGQPVTITVPPAADVKDISQSNLGSLLGGLTSHTP